MAQQQELNVKRVALVVIGVLGLILILAFSSRMFHKINAGERAVIFRQFGNGLDKENIYQPGFVMIAPWNDLYVYNVMEQSSEETMSVLDKNGLEIGIDITVRYHPKYSEVGFLHESFGVKYDDVLVTPEVRSVVRNVAGKYTAEEIFSSKRTDVESGIINQCNAKLGENYINMTALLIRGVNLPPKIKNAIELKLQREQEAEAYKYLLDKEEQEAQRKKIEAEGIARYNEIISNSLTDKILTQKGIDATLDLSKSQNSKVIVVGSGENGLPLILGNN